jgi:hypothetical protein
VRRPRALCSLSLGVRVWAERHGADCAPIQQEECERGLSAAYLTELAVGASRGGTVDFVPVTIASLQTLDDYGVLSAVNLSLPYSIRSTYEGTTGVCAGALHTLELTMLHDGLGTLTAVHAALVLTDVTSRCGCHRQRAHPSRSPLFPLGSVGTGGLLRAARKWSQIAGAMTLVPKTIHTPVHHSQ